MNLASIKTTSIEKVVLYITLALFFLIVVILFIIFLKKLPRKSKAKSFKLKWKNLQKLYSDSSSWGSAIQQADDLLDKALKRRSVKGQSMGERIVNANKILTDSDSVWAAHKLRNKIDQNPNFKLAKEDVKRTLLSFLQAIRDLGSL